MVQNNKQRKERWVVGVGLAAALLLGLIGGVPASPQQGGSDPGPSIAYAEDCDGPHPPPNLDCPNPPTPTPTPTRDPDE